VAFVALFFALGASAVAGTKYLTADTQITQGDLAGSTYGDPLIANGAVTNSKLANPSLTISPGTGLKGGGSIALGGSGSLSVDLTKVQSRVLGSCGSATAMVAIGQDGFVACDTPYAPQWTITTDNGTVNAFSTTSIEGNQCPAGYAAINAAYQLADYHMSVFESWPEKSSLDQTIEGVYRNTDWHIQISNPDGHSHGFSLYVMCMSIPPGQL
jgi:hypothetical protein